MNEWRTVRLVMARICQLCHEEVRPGEMMWQFRPVPNQYECNDCRQEGFRAELSRN